jgi:carbamoyl-phosphate synthase large subunit
VKELDVLLITGCGGDIGQSIGKILKMEYPKCKLIGCDIHDKHAAHFIYDECITIPRVDAPDYMESLVELTKKYNPNLIIPMSEAELRFFADNKTTAISGIKLIMANAYAMNIGNNKLFTQELLRENGLPYAWTVKANEGNPIEFPCIIKDLAGRGSKDVSILQAKDYDPEHSYESHIIFQELLLPDHEEYTCGLFRSSEGDIRTIVFRRNLFQGYTNYAEVSSNAEIDNLLHSLANILQLHGSMNVQLRLTEKKGPVVFEINSRFSSTVLFRYMLGYKDLIWTIQDNLNIPIDDYKSPKTSARIYKGWQEYIQYDDGARATIDNYKFLINRW